MTEATKLEKMAVIGILGIAIIYFIYLGRIDDAKGFMYALITYFLSREGV